MEKKKKSNNKVVIILIIALIVVSLLLIYTFLLFGYEIQRADYYKDVMLTYCEIALTEKNIIDTQIEMLSLYYDMSDMELPDLKDCDYWLLEEDK